MKYLLILLLFSAGCFNSGARHAQLSEQFNQFERQNIVRGAVYVKAADDSLNRIPQENRTREVELAQNFTSMAESLLPKPQFDLGIDVNKLLSEDIKARNEALAVVEQRFNEDGKRLKEMEVVKERLDKVEGILIDKGKEYEKIQKSNFIRGLILKFGLTTVILGGIALVVFVPALLPVFIGIFTNIIGALMSMMPGLINFFGVVSKKAYQVTVKGVSDIRGEFKKNPDKVYTGKDVQKIVDEKLNHASDEYPHAKVIVEKQRKALKLDNYKISAKD